MYLLNEKRQVKGLVVFLLVFALLITGCAGPLVRTASAGGPSVAEQLGINNEEEPEVPEVMGDISEKEVDLIGEDIDLRSKYIKQFVREDKAIQAVIYEQAVHYEEDGVFKDIDNTLVLNRDEKGAEVYRNKDNGYYNVSLNPNENAKGDTILMEREDSSLSWKLVSVNFAKGQNMQRSTGEKPIVILPNETAQRKVQTGRNEKMMMLDKLTSGAKYSNVYKGVSLEYFMLPEKVKENIVLDSYIENAEFVFRLSMTNLDAKQKEDGVIVLINTKTGEEVFYIEAPYMVDAEMEYCADVKMTLVQNGGNTQLVITPNDEWLKKAAYPVKIDPTVITQIDETNVDDAYCSEGYPTTEYGAWSILKVGEGSSSQTNFSFIKFNNLPDIDSSHMVVDARLNLYLWKNTDEDDVQVNVHKVTESWDESTVNWSNKPGYNSTIEDYEIVSSIDTGYSWEITGIAREWYKTGNNYGLMVRETPNDTDYIEFYSAEGWGSITMPYSTITYVSNAGLESYWTYHSQSVGRAGTGYVNDYNGNLIYIHNDYSGRGNRMPVNISHVYNSCLRNKEGEFGDGWTLNIAQEISFETIGGIDYYKYIDEDATAHYFYKNDNNKWVSEDGLDLELIESFTYENVNCVKIIDKKDNYKLFYPVNDSIRPGKLRDIFDNNGNDIHIAYETSTGRINHVYDGIDRYINLIYDSDTKLQRITDPSGRNVASFYYDTSDRLIKIRYADHTTENSRETVFTYDSHGNMTRAENFDGYYMSYTYSSTEPYRVIKIEEKHGTNVGSRLEMEYGGNSTLFTDYDGREVLFQFNDYGHTVCVTNEHSLGTGLEYNTSGTNTNTISSVGKTRRTTTNYFKDSSFDVANTYWDFNSEGGSLGSSGYSTAKSYQGNKSVLLNKTNTTGSETVSQDFTVAQNAYTLTGYFYADTNYTQNNNKGAYLYIKYKNSDNTWSMVKSPYVKQKSSWQRFVVTVWIDGTLQTGDIVAGAGLEGETGNVYLDNMQLERGNSPNPYNIVQNPDLTFVTSGIPDFWDGVSLETNDGVISVPTSEKIYGLDSNVIEINGKATVYKQLKQDLSLAGKKGDTYTIGGWMKGDANEIVKLSVRFVPAAGGDNNYQNIYFNQDITEWQYKSGEVVAPFDYSSMRVYFCSRYTSNTMLFDGMHLYKEEFGQSFTYDDSGNIISVTDLANKEDEFIYNSNNDLTKVTSPKGNTISYTYDNNHNITHARTELLIDYFYDYDSYGNMTVSEINTNNDRQGTLIRTTMTYGNSGNTLNLVTDERGKVTDYDFADRDKALLTEITAPNGADIRYVYNSNTDVLERVYLDSNDNNTFDSTEINNLYTYEDDKLTKLTSNDFSYFFVYDDFGYATDVKVGNDSNKTTLVTNIYDTHKGILTECDYGNGDEISYVYDSLDRPIRKFYDDVIRFKYYYNGDGLIGRQKDFENGINYHFMYDAAGRLGMIDRTNGIRSWYKYDDDLSTPETTEYFYEFIGDTGKTFESTYQSNKDGLPLYAQIEEDNGTDYKVNVTERDSKNRLQVVEYMKNGVIIFGYEYDYIFADDGNQTNLIKNYRYMGSSVVTDTFTYDDNGNIATITTGNNVIQYYYDDLNQLKRENNPFYGTNGKTIIYTYDKNGNIDEIKEYAHTSGTATPTTLLDTIDYTYDSTWKDKLTSYDGKAITYDSIGNPLTYDGWEYTWKWGRRLATAGNTSQGISTSYKYNDSGIRTQKTVTDNGNTTTYNYNLMGNNITYEERTGANACEMYYAYDNGGKLFGFYYEGASNDGFYYYKRNLQGDIIGILNSSGTEVVTYLYDAWGSLLSTTGTLASTIGADNPFRYRGYYYDTETSLYYLNQRYYNPEWGRFINADDFMGQTGGLLSHNVYAYCGNNPVMREDPDGDWWQLIAAAVGAVVGVVGQVVSDLTTSALTGELQFSSWQTYVGAGAGGAVGGVVFATTGNVQLAGATSAATTTFVGEGLTKLTTPDYEKSWVDIGKEATVDAFFGAMTASIPGSLPGSHSYNQIYRAGMTKLMNNTCRMSLKTMAKGVVANTFSGIGLDAYYGLKQAIISLIE